MHDKYRCNPTNSPIDLHAHKSTRSQDQNQFSSEYVSYIWETQKTTYQIAKNQSVALSSRRQKLCSTQMWDSTEEWSS